MEYHPLVSIAVITYNSAQYIIETLESAKGQTYQNLELIISDDCSIDNTVDLCKAWLSSNSDRFTRVKLLMSDTNTGISANVNRVFRACDGEWIKPIAGDDILLPYCVEANLEFIDKHSSARVIFSQCQNFETVKGEKRIIDTSPSEEYKYLFELDAEKQLVELYGICFPPACNLFIHHELHEKFSHDESIRNVDDYPYWIQITQQGYKLYYFDLTTVLYRVGESLSHSIDKFYSTSFMDSIVKFWDSIMDMTMLYHPSVARERKIQIKLYFFTKRVLRNRKNLLTKLVRKVAIKCYHAFL